MSRPTSRRRQSRRATGGGVTALLLSVALVAPSAQADNLQLAHRLLRVTGVAEEFQRAASQQTADIVRTYTLIFKSETNLDLPDTIKHEISNCYEQAYAWDNFEDGIAGIFAENLSQSDLLILIDFFSDLSVPPPQIQQFKDLISRAHEIEQRALNYMFDQSQGCDEFNVRVIRTYLADQGS